MSSPLKKIRGPKVSIDYKRAWRRHVWRMRIGAVGSWVLFWLCCLIFVAAVAAAVQLVAARP